MSADGKKNLLEAIKQGREEEVERLVRQGEDVNSVFFFNRTPLHCAVAKKMTRMVEMILRLNPDVKVKRINGKYKISTPSKVDNLITQLNCEIFFFFL